jgi:hypothetical protein
LRPALSSSAPFFPFPVGFSGKFGWRRAIAAIMWKPAQLGHHLGCQLYAMGIDLEAPFKDFAVAGDHIQIAACGLGVDNLAPAVLQLFKTAAAALLAKGIPLFSIAGHISHGNRGKTSRKWRRDRYVHHNTAGYVVEIMRAMLGSELACRDNNACGATSQREWFPVLLHHLGDGPAGHGFFSRVPSFKQFLYGFSSRCRVK